MMRCRSALLLVVATVSVLAPVSAAADLTGSWRVDTSPDILGTGPEIWSLTQGPSSLMIAPGFGSGTLTGALTGQTYFFDLGPAQPPFDVLCPHLQMTLTPDPNDILFAASHIGSYGIMCHPFAVMHSGIRCDGTPATPEECIPPLFLTAGTKLVLRDKANDPSRRRLVVLSVDPSYVAPVPGSALDPRTPLGNGATITVARGTEEQAVVSLPRAGWRGLGNPAGVKGYAYKRPLGDVGPCRRARIKNGLLKAACRGAGIGFSLDEPSQGALGVTFVTGPAPVGVCMHFGGSIVRDQSTASAATGIFKATRAPAPAQCAVP